MSLFAGTTTGAAAGRVASTAYGYNPQGQLTGLTHVLGAAASPTATTLASTFMFDAAGGLTGMSTPDGSATLTVDADGRLTKVTPGNGSSLPAEAYAYDKAGNRTSVGIGGSPSATVTTPNSNQVSSDGTYAYVYDAAGNETSRTPIDGTGSDAYVYDDRDRLVSDTVTASGSPTATVSYTYWAGNNERASRTVTTGSTSTTEYYVYGPDGNLLEVLNGSGQVKERDLTGPGLSQVLATETVAVPGTAGTRHWLMTNQVGSVTDVVNDDGSVADHVVYTSYGVVYAQTAAANAVRFGFAGMRTDAATGLDYDSARWYDAGQGRFATRDPLGFGGGDADEYRYVGGDPAQWSDPTGLTAANGSPRAGMEPTPWGWRYAGDGPFGDPLPPSCLPTDDGTAAGLAATGGFDDTPKSVFADADVTVESRDALAAGLAELAKRVAFYADRLAGRNCHHSVNRAADQAKLAFYQQQHDRFATRLLATPYVQSEDGSGYGTPELHGGWAMAEHVAQGVAIGAFGALTFGYGYAAAAGYVGTAWGFGVAGTVAVGTAAGGGGAYVVGKAIHGVDELAGAPAANGDPLADYLAQEMMDGDGEGDPWALAQALAYTGLNTFGGVDLGEGLFNVDLGSRTLLDPDGGFNANRTMHFVDAGISAGSAWAGGRMSAASAAAEGQQVAGSVCKKICFVAGTPVWVAVAPMPAEASVMQGGHGGRWLLVHRRLMAELGLASVGLVGWYVLTRPGRKRRSARANLGAADFDVYDEPQLAEPVWVTLFPTLWWVRQQVLLRRFRCGRPATGVRVGTVTRGPHRPSTGS